MLPSSCELPLLILGSRLDGVNGHPQLHNACIDMLALSETNFVFIIHHLHAFESKQWLRPRVAALNDCASTSTFLIKDLYQWAPVCSKRHHHEIVGVDIL